MIRISESLSYEEDLKIECWMRTNTRIFKNLRDPGQKHKQQTQEMEKNKPPQAILLKIRNKKEKG